MTEKRFIIVHLRDITICDIQDTLQDIPTFYNDLGRIENIKPVVDLLNELYDENEQLKKENYKLHKRLGDFEPFEKHITVNEVTGLNKIYESTNSIESKKELYR